MARTRMEPKTLSRPWLANSIRLTVFPVAPWEAPAELWQSVVGDAPEIDQNQPKQGFRVQSGQWQDGLLQVSVNPIRIDWTASPAIQATEQGVGPNHKFIADLLPPFVAVTAKWLASAGCEVKRLAFGVTGLLAAPDRIASYRLLEELLPHIPIEAERSSDFIYQINHPVHSRSADIELNRLTRWNGLALRLIIGQEGSTQSVPVTATYFASLDCDHNTPAENEDRLDKSLVMTIYDELVQLAWDNLEAGEIP